MKLFDPCADALFDVTVDPIRMASAKKVESSSADSFIIKTFKLLTCQERVV